MSESKRRDAAGKSRADGPNAAKSHSARKPSAKRAIARKPSTAKGLMWAAGAAIALVVVANLQWPLSSAESTNVGGMPPVVGGLPPGIGGAAPAAATVGGVYVAPVARVTPPRAADEAPDFSWTKADGITTSLSQYRGRVVLVNFWATWCPPCRRELPGIINLRNDLVDEGVEVIGIAIGERPPAGTSAETHVAAFAAENDVTYPVITGTDALANAYGGINAIPTSFIIDRKGRIVETIEGALDEAGFRAAIARAMERR